MAEEKTYNVLVVDDDELLRDVLGDIIDSLGYSVNLAGSGEEAIGYFENSPYDIVFTDLGMEDMTGWEVAEKIKQLRPETIVILLTGWGASAKDEASQSPNVDFFVGKPFQFEEVEGTIQKAVDLLSK